MPWYGRLQFTMSAGTAKHVNPTAQVNSGNSTVCLMLFRCFFGGHANDGGDTTAGSNSILAFATEGRGGGGGDNTAAATGSVKCPACFLILQGGGHANNGGDTTSTQLPRSTLVIPPWA